MTSTQMSPDRTPLTVPVRPAAIATVLGTLAFTALGTFGDGTDGADHGAEGVPGHRAPSSSRSPP